MGEALGWILFLASPVHVVATGCLFTFPELRDEARRHRLRYVWLPAAILAASATTAACLGPRQLAWLLLAFFAWQVWHFQKQNLGLVALAARRCGTARPGLRERRALGTAACCAIAGLVSHPRLLGLGLDTGLQFLTPIAAVAYIATVVAGGIGSVQRSLHGAVSAGALLFWVPVFLFHSPGMAFGLLVVLHGAEYLWLVGIVLRGPHPVRVRLDRLSAMILIVLGAGALLSLASHLHTQGTALRWLYGAYLGVVMWHFLVDARVWRLRDPVTRAFLGSRLPSLFDLG